MKATRIGDSEILGGRHWRGGIVGAKTDTLFGVAAESAVFRLPVTHTNLSSLDWEGRPRVTQIDDSDRHCRWARGRGPRAHGTTLTAAPGGVRPGSASEDLRVGFELSPTVARPQFECHGRSAAGPPPARVHAGPGLSRPGQGLPLASCLWATTGRRHDSETFPVRVSPPHTQTLKDACISAACQRPNPGDPCIGRLNAAALFKINCDPDDPCVRVTSLRDCMKI